jgi:hypothetical protein
LKLIYLFLNIILFLGKMGSIPQVNAGCPLSVPTSVTEEAITAEVKRGLSSSGATARKLELPQALVLNQLHSDELQPYHYAHNRHQLPEGCPTAEHLS